MEDLEINIKRKNRFCEEQQVYCRFANRCIYCEYYVGDRLCQKSYLQGKNTDYTICHGNNRKCFRCDNIKFERNRNFPSYCKEASKQIEQIKR